MIRLLFLIGFCTTSAHAALKGLSSLAARESLAIVSEQLAVVRIRCRLDTTMRYFRGVLIEPADRDVGGDVVLTAVHGLPDDTDVIARSCAVIGSDGAGNLIARVWRPPLRGRVSSSDWAVLLTEAPVGGPVQRMPVLADPAAVLSELEAIGAAVRLPLLTRSAERQCHLIGRPQVASSLQPQLFAHTCRAWPGHSGSPLLVDVDGATFVLGIHLGRHRNFIEHTVLGIGLTIDAAIAAAIDAAFAASAPAQEPARASRAQRRHDERTRSATTLR